VNDVPELELLEEAKVSRLLDNPLESRFEASGVCLQAGTAYVVFDNSTHLARFTICAGRLSRTHDMRPLHSHFSGYEDIAYDPNTERFFMLIEAEESTPGRYKARVEEYDRELNFIASNWIDFLLKHRNKGMEGLACTRLDGETWLLALCEGNRCKGGAKGRRPGHGRIQLFSRGELEWAHRGTLKLPKSLRCEDYSALDLYQDRLLVASQASGLLWVGRLQAERMQLQDQGRTYRFPTTRRHKPRYCNIEGVAWLTDDLILAVSDKRKPGVQPKRCRRTDQSIHIFRIPDRIEY